MELLGEYNMFPSEYSHKYANKGHGHASYLSSTVCDEFVSLITQFKEIYLQNEERWSLLLTGGLAPDFSNVDQLTCTICISDGRTLYSLSSDEQLTRLKRRLGY